MTVVIPVWGARYVASLERAIASVRAQDAAVPIIVADNASDVEVPEIPGTTLVRSPRRLSVGAARNFGLERVQSELVIVLDADDELTPGALASLRAGIDADRGVAVYSMSLLEADTGARHRTPRRFVPALARRPRLFALATAIWSLYPIQGSAILRTAGFARRGRTPTVTGETTGWWPSRRPSAAGWWSTRARAASTTPTPSPCGDGVARHPTCSRRRGRSGRGWRPTRPCRAGRAPCSH